jgi:dedicator of cytokinesis protein 3
VLIGIFPSSCVHIRPEASEDDGTLSAAYQAAVERFTRGENGKVTIWGEGMEAVKEEEEEEEGNKVGSPTREPDVFGVVEITSPGIGSTATMENRRNSIGGRPKRPKSLIVDKLDTANEDKDQPPLPRLTAGDSTIAGQQYPLVDEIACAVREWYTRLPTYLANREYRLFSTVTQHIDALFLGRRQLLSRMLSADELSRVRRECVSRLVKCNVAQGLDVIVRSMGDGSVVVFEKDRAFAGASWASGMTCYAQQVQVRTHNRFTARLRSAGLH